MGKSTNPAPQRRNARQQAQIRAEQERKQKQKQKRVLGGAGLAVLVILIAVAVLVFNHIRATVSTQQQVAASLPVDGIDCLTTEALAYHIHAHLTLYQDGKPVTLPANIGIPVGSNIPGGTCYYWLHVHDTTGVVHVESPTTRTYTLGQFLDVWQRTAQLDAQGNSAYRVDDGFARALRAANPGDIHVYVGDQLTSDYASIPLTAHALITIEVGASLQPPTTAYQFPAGE